MKRMRYQGALLEDVPFDAEHDECPQYLPKNKPLAPSVEQD